MMTPELFFGVALFASVCFTYASVSAIRQADRKLVLEKNRKWFLYTIAVVVPLIGFILTRNLKQQL